MKTRNIILFTLTVGLMSSCKIVKPLYQNYERPDSIKAEGIYGDQQSGSQSMSDVQWRQIFTDPKLQTLIEKTLKNNADMQQAEINIEEAETALKCAKLAYIPSITFSPSGTLSKVIDMQEGFSKIYSLPVSASWSLGSVGNLRNSKKKAEVSLEETKVVKLSIQTQLVASVAKLYYNLAMLDENILLCQETVKNWEKNLEVTKKLMEAGQSNLAGVSSTEANIYAIKTNVVDLQHSRREIENTLTALMGETPGEISRGTLDSWQTPAIVTTGVPDTLLQRRPDVRLAELQLASAFYDKNIAYSQFFPGLTLTGTLSWTNSVGQQIINPGKLIASGVAALTQPIFRNGAIRAQYKVSQLEMQKYAINFQQTLIDAGSEVNTALAAIQTANAKKELLKNQVQSLQTAVTATRALWSESNINYLQILTAQTGLLNTQMTEISNKMDAINNTITLYQALGGGIE